MPTDGIRYPVLTYMGKAIEDMTRDELIAAVHHMIRLQAEDSVRHERQMQTVWSFVNA